MRRLPPALPLPVNLADLKHKSTEQLSELADGLSVEGAHGMQRQELIFALLRAQSQRRGEIRADGVLEVLPDGFGFLRAADASYAPGPDDIYVSPSQIRRFNLRTGDTIAGLVRPPKENERYFALLKIEEVNGGSPEGERQKILFENFTPVHPGEKLALEHDPAAVSTRVLDLLCPIGKGQRCLITSPPRAGKTLLIRDIALALEKNHPELTLIVLLIDERPEEVTEMRRAISGEVVSSTFDEPPTRHVQVAEIALEKAKRLAERKQDAVILLDSLSRLGRAYAAAGQTSDRALEGGLDAGALHRPKRFFGAARNLEEGGSLTIVATALTESGSRTDDAILEELEGTANCEIRLDRELAERRLFPALDLARSGTHHEELLVSEALADKLQVLRDQLRGLAKEEAMKRLLDQVESTASNEELIASIMKT